MYLSRSQIINRDSVVWIEGGEKHGQEREDVGKEGWVKGSVGWSLSEQEVRLREGMGSDRRADG